MRRVIPIALLCVGVLPQASLSEAMNGQDARTAPTEQLHSEADTPDPATRADAQNTGTRDKTELHFDPATQTVTVRVWVYGAGGTFIPNIRPDNFVVYENGVRQPEPTVEVERLPLTLGILLEYGGRHSALNAALADAISAAVRQFHDETSPQDKVAFWRYGDRVEELSGFSESHDQLLRMLSSLGAPPLSETNLHDALIDAVGRLGSMSGRKALVLVSSGLDTFSNHGLGDALAAIRRAAIPVYVINLDPILEQDAALNTDLTRYEPVDWKRASQELREIARVSGGQIYSPQSSYGWSEIYDNLMESLRVRYVITYRPTTTAAGPRKVRIEILTAKMHGPLRGVNPNARPSHEWTVAEDRYTPGIGVERQPPTTDISAAGPGTGSSVQ